MRKNQKISIQVRLLPNLYHMTSISYLIFPTNFISNQVHLPVNLFTKLTCDIVASNGIIWGLCLVDADFIDLAKETIRGIFELDLLSDGYYAILSNIYVGA